MGETGQGTLTSVAIDCTDHPIKTPPHFILAGVVVHRDFHQAHFMVAEHSGSCMWVDFFGGI